MQEIDYSKIAQSIQTHSNAKKSKSLLSKIKEAYNNKAEEVGRTEFTKNLIFLGIHVVAFPIICKYLSKFAEKLDSLQ